MIILSGSHVQLLKLFKDDDDQDDDEDDDEDDDDNDDDDHDHEIQQLLAAQAFHSMKFIGNDDEDVNYEDFNDDKEDGNKNDHGKEDNVKKIAKFGTSNINMLSVEQFKMLVHHKHCNYIQ